MYAVTDSTEGDYYLCVPPDPGIEAAALGASRCAAPGTSESGAPSTSESAAPGAGDSALSGTTPTEALHTFTLDSGASRSFFRDSTTLTPLSRPVAVSLADPSGGPVLAHSSTVLPCPAALSGLLSGLHLPSFSTNLVSEADLQDLWVDQFTPRGQRLTHCTCSRTGRHLATFTRRPGSSLYTLTTASPPVTASGQVAASGQVWPPVPLSLVSPGPSLPFLRGLPLPVFPVSRAGAAGAGAAGGTGAGGAAGVVAGDPGAEGTGAVSAVSGGAAWPQSYYVPLLHPPPVQSQSRLRPASPVLGPSPYSRTSRGLTERREPESRPESPVCAVCTGSRVPRQRPPPVPGTHSMTLCPSTAPHCVPLPSPPTSSLPDGPDPESDSLRAVSPTITRFLATDVTDPSFESTAASALVSELVDFADACLLDNAASLVAESESASVCPPSVGGECVLGTDVLEDRHEEFECFAAAVPHLVSMLLAPEGDPNAPDIPTPRSYAEAIEDDLVFATADTEALAHVKSELQKRHTRTDLGELTIYLGLRITRDRAQCTITLTQSHMVQQVLQRFGFTYSSPQSTPLPTGHSLSAPPSNKSVEPSGPYPELVGCLMDLMTSTQPDLAYPLSILARYVAPGRHKKEHMDAAKRVLHYLCSTSGMGLVLGGRARVVLTGHADASWELRWLTYLLTDLGEAPRSPPVLYVDNKAMLSLCQEHITKHIALRYFLARELQQRGQFCLAYVATQANIADIFTKALQPCDHQRFCTTVWPRI
ncbi:unnamed protein product [Closterium sp. NIES-54]